MESMISKLLHREMGKWASSVPERTKLALSKVHPYRVFDAAVSVLGTYVSKDSTQKVCDTLTDHTLLESVSEFKALQVPSAKLNSRVLKRAKILAFKDLFPHGKPNLSVCYDKPLLMQSINWSANHGVDKYVKKRDLRQLYSSWFDKFSIESLKAEVSKPALAYSKPSVSSDKIGLRSVYAVSGLVAASESRFTVPLIKHFGQTRESSYAVGYKQKELSSLAVSFDKYNKLSLDYSRFDKRLHPEITSAAFDLIFDSFVLSKLEYTYLTVLKVVFMKGGTYHPAFGVLARICGLPSGSCFTNIIGSFSNLIILRYCFTIMQFNHFVVRIVVHGDDGAVGSTVVVPLNRLSKLIDNMGMILKPEKCEQTAKGVSDIYFLGSRWVKGLPQRDLVTCANKVCLVRGKPIILESKREYVKSRVYTYFGYDHRLPQIWEDLGFGRLEGSSVYVLAEGLDWEFARQAKMKGVIGTWITAPADPWIVR
jgi:hypothetical protein